MQVHQEHWVRASGWTTTRMPIHPFEANLVLCFGGTALVEDPALYERLRAAHPRAQIVTASDAGEISGVRVLDESIVVTAVAFAKTAVRGVEVDVTQARSSESAGRHLAASLTAPGLCHVVVISDGLEVNGSDLARGLRDGLPGGVVVTGGLSGDGARFQRTLVGLDRPPVRGNVVAIGFYGADLRVGYGSLGGWDSFGPDRIITRSVGNVLYELDGQPALDLYKLYLGDEAAGLPATGLLFPLSLRCSATDEPVVRTILAVDETAGSMTFAGDVPVGCYARLMKANFDRLIDGAMGAAAGCRAGVDGRAPDLALLISCVGRKLVLGQRIEEEVEAVRDVLGESTVLAGFYSYGEICPHVAAVRCELHNQTMTITTFTEL